ncbi:MAG: DUF4388 domain-containing protein [Acidobacteriota bacterium]
MDATQPSTLNLDLEGELHSYTLPSLLFGISQSRETGVLRLEQLTVSMKQIRKTIYIQEGAAIFATSNDRDDRLGQVFLRRGMISLERLIASIDRSLAERKRLGTMLVEEGWIRPVDLVTGISEQVKEIIYSLFQWTDGCYQYKMGELPTKEIITLQMSTRNLVLEGINRIQSWYRIQEAIGGLDTRFQTSPNIRELTHDMKLSLEQWSLLSLCDEPAPLRLILASSPLKDFDICRLMWAFVATGVVRRVS